MLAARRCSSASPQANIITAINRLIRHIEKDRAEQKIIAGMLDHVREFLAFTLPTPTDHDAANALMEARNEVFYGRLPTYFVSGSKAKVTTYMEMKTNNANACPKCGTGDLRLKEGRQGIFWYCTNWDASPKCDATFPDKGGRPKLPEAISSKS